MSNAALAADGSKMLLWVIFAMSRRVATLPFCFDLPKVGAAIGG